jgi:GWxTD domain-containing protein
MTVRPTTALAFILVALWAPTAARAQKLDKDDKKWLDTARPLMTPDEEKTFKGLKDKADRLEFQKIFWARRDPNLETPENEFQTEYLKAYAAADQYKIPGKAGVETDCGRIFLLLGKPDDVKKEQVGANPTARSPETWTYRDRPGQTFSGGKAEISVDETCSLPPGAKLKEQLDRLAEAKVAQPNIGYKVEKDGHLVKLADQLPKPSVAQALLKTPRQDFPVAAQAGYLKVQDGGTALIGLVRGDATGLAAEDVSGKKTVKVVVAANLTSPDGKVAGFAEEPTVAEVKDGHFVASFRISAKAGKYTLRAGAIEEKSGKGSLAEVPVDVPNLNTGEMCAASVIALEDVQDVENPDPRHPYAAFVLAKARLIARFGGVFSKAEAASFFYQVYDLKTDEAGKASGVASVTMMKDGTRTVVAKAEPLAIETPVGGTVVGPVPLGKYEPGKYIVQLKVRDNLAKKDLTQELPFEVKP